MSVLITGTMQAFGSAARAQRIQRDQTRAMALARQLMAEVMQNAYTDANDQGILGTETGEVTGTRLNFNDVDDYGGWTETPPKMKDGTTIAGYTGWKRTIDVKWVSLSSSNFNTASGLSSDSSLKRIKVSVTSPTGAIAVLYGLRSAHSGYENLPATSTTYTSWIGLALQVGSDATTTANSSVNPVNQVP